MSPLFILWHKINELYFMYIERGIMLKKEIHFQNIHTIYYNYITTPKLCYYQYIVLIRSFDIHE